MGKSGGTFRDGIKPFGEHIQESITTDISQPDARWRWQLWKVLYLFECSSLNDDAYSLESSVGWYRLKSLKTTCTRSRPRPWKS